MSKQATIQSNNVEFWRGYSAILIQLSCSNNETDENKVKQRVIRFLDLSLPSCFHASALY